MADLTESLNRLNATVSAKREPLRQIQRDEKAYLREHHPDMADFLSAMTNTFNRPGDIRRIRVKDATGPILDSNHWK